MVLRSVRIIGILMAGVLFLGTLSWLAQAEAPKAKSGAWVETPSASRTLQGGIEKKITIPPPQASQQKQPEPKRIEITANSPLARLGLLYGPEAFRTLKGKAEDTTLRGNATQTACHGIRMVEDPVTGLVRRECVRNIIGACLIVFPNDKRPYSQQAQQTLESHCPRRWMAMREPMARAMAGPENEQNDAVIRRFYDMVYDWKTCVEREGFHVRFMIANE